MAVKLAPNARWDRSDTGVGFPLTFTCWFRPDQLPADFAALFYAGSVSYSDHLGVFIHQATSRVSVWDSTFNNRAETAPLELGRWVFLGVAVTEAGAITLAWRGEQETSLHTASGTYSGGPLSDDFLYLGSDRNAPDFNFTVDAAFAYARVFNTALTPAQMLAESGRTRAVADVGPNGADWPLDETSGLDESGNGNHLTLEEGTGSAALTVGPSGMLGPPPPFPDGPIEHRIQLGLGGEWVDATGWVEDQQITMRRGKGEEASRAQPAELQFTLENGDGQWTPQNPMSPWWPHIGRGVRVRYQTRWAGEWHTRFVGEATSWAPVWPEGDNATDDQPSTCFVPVEASGVLRRLIQGDKPLQSAIRRRVLAPEFADRVVAFWPFEDGSESETAASPLAGVRPAVFGGDRSFGGDDTLPGAAAVATIAGERPAGWQGHIPPRTSSNWRCDWWMRIPEALESGFFTVMIVFSTGTTARWEVAIGANSMRLRGFSRGGTQQFTNSVAHGGAVGPWIRWSLAWSQIGGSVSRALSWGPLGTAPADMTSITGTSANHRAGRPASMANLFTQAPPEGFSVGPMVVSTGLPLEWLREAETGWHSEPAGERLARLCAEEDIPFTFDGDLAETEPMGVQRPDNLVTLLDEAADADSGVLAEPLDADGLHYRTRRTLERQTPRLTLDASTRVEDGRVTSDLQNPLAPVLDDQRLRNDVAVTRPGGTSERVTDPASIAAEERYDHTASRNVATDRQLEQHAGWLLAFGTLPDMRLPALTPDLTIAPHLIPAWLATRLGDRARAENLPSQHPPGGQDVLIESWSETTSPNRWEVSLTCSPAVLWDVGILDDDPDDPDTSLPALDTDQSILAEAVDAEQTTIGVETLQGPRWTTNPIWFPLPGEIGGERVEVTGITGTDDASPMVGQGNNGTPSTSHVAPSVDTSGDADLLICGWMPWSEPGTYSLPSGMTAVADTSGTWGTLQTASETLTSDGPTGTRTATFSDTDPWAAVTVAVHRSLSGTPTVEQVLSGVETGDPVPDLTLTTGVATEAGWWLLAVHGWVQDTAGTMPPPSGDGWALAADAWDPTDLFPRIRVWAKRVTDPGPQEVTFTGPPTLNEDSDQHAHLLVLSGVTAGIQAFTVTRSLNDVTRGWPAGTPVRVADPIRLAL